MNKSTLNNFSHSVSWGSILLGIFIALTITTLLNFLGIGLNLIAFSPEEETLSSMGIFSIIWIMMTSILSMFAGGWIAGRMSGYTSAVEGALHGLGVCGVSIFLAFALVAFVGSTAGIMSSVVTNDLVNNNSYMDHAKTTEEIQQYAGDLRGNHTNQNGLEQATKISKISAGVSFMLFISFLLSTIAGGLGGVRGAASVMENHRSTSRRREHAAT